MFALQLHSLLQILEQRGVRQAADLHVISLVRPGGWSSDARSPCRIIAEQQKTFAGLIQSSHRREPWQRRALKTAVNGIATLLIPPRRHQAARFVQHDDSS